MTAALNFFAVLRGFALRPLRLKVFLDAKGAKQKCEGPQRLGHDEPQSLLAPLRRLHELIRQEVTRACERSPVAALAAVAREEGGDTIYTVDRVSEELLVEFFGREIAPRAPLVLVAEGLPEGQVVLPRGA